MSDEFWKLHVKYDSIKARAKHKYSHYFLKDVYPLYFEPRRNESLSIFEIGIYRGGSLKAMKEYFPNASLVGLDLVLQISEEDRISLVKGGQQDISLLEQIGKDHGKFDIVIDDGSHRNSHQVASLKAIWPYMNTNGLYFIEDVTETNNGRHILRYLKGLATRERFVRREISDIISIAFYQGIIVLQKGEGDTFKE